MARPQCDDKHHGSTPLVFAKALKHGALSLSLSLSLSIVPLKLVWMLDSPKQPLPLSHSLSLVPLKLVWMLDSPKQPLPLSLFLTLSLTLLLKLFSFPSSPVGPIHLLFFLLHLFVWTSLFAQRISWVQMERLKKTHTHTHTYIHQLLHTIWNPTSLQ